MDDIANIRTTAHNHQEDSADSCPVTCFCDCCGMSISYEPLQLFFIKSTIEIPTMVYADYQSNYWLDLLSEIWQPPQMIG